MFKPNPAAYGVPWSATCRWCGTNRMTVAGKVLVCLVCDMVRALTEPEPLAEEQEPEGA